MVNYYLRESSQSRGKTRRSWDKYGQVSLPSWLNVEAEKAGVNVSAVLQAALKKELHIVE